MDTKEFLEQVQKRRSAMIASINEFTDNNSIGKPPKVEYQFWITGFCQMIAYLIDTEFDHDETILSQSIDTINAYYKDSKDFKEGLF